MVYTKRLLPQKNIPHNLEKPPDFLGRVNFSRFPRAKSTAGPASG